MTASEDEALYEAAKALYYTCSDEEIRIRCLEREEYYQDLRNYERAIEQERSEHEQERLEHAQDLQNYRKTLEQERSEREQERSEHKQNLQNYERTCAEQAAEIQRLRTEIETLKK